MSRELMFSVWDVAQGKMMEYTTKIGGDGSDFKFRQFIGIRDCKQKPIYHFDICRDTISKQLYIVEWEAPGFYFEAVLNEPFEIEQYKLCKEGRMEVIGNVFENEDLCECE